MKFYKVIVNDYIVAIIKGRKGQIEISENEYNQIHQIIQNKPLTPDGYSYKLKTDMTWELVELPPQPEPEQTIEEDMQKALQILGVD